MAIGSVNLNAGSLRNAGLDNERNAAESRRADASKPNEAAARDTQPGNERQQFVLDASAYRRVVATLEADRSANLQREGDNTYTAQRAQRAYQDAAGDAERESLSTLFGVDVFA